MSDDDKSFNPNEDVEPTIQPPKTKKRPLHSNADASSASRKENSRKLAIKRREQTSSKSVATVNDLGAGIMNSELRNVVSEHNSGKPPSAKRLPATKATKNIKKTPQNVEPIKSCIPVEGVLHAECDDKFFDNYDVVIPPNFGSNGEYTLLVQIDPEDSASLDFTGAVGAIGRLETVAEGVVLDFKGCQYRGRIYPGSTAVVLSTNGKKADTQLLKVESMTDEFCRLTKEGNAMEKLNAIVRGDMVGYQYQFREDDVNRNTTVQTIESSEPTSKKKQLTSTTGGSQKKRR